MLLSPMFVAQVRELNKRPGGRSMLMLFPCRCEEASYAHAMMSALLNANTEPAPRKLAYVRARLQVEG